jgi:hypothetical protein
MTNELHEKITLPIIQIPRALLDYIEKNLHKPKDIKKILASRKSNFENEYLKLNALQASSTCEVKIDSKYKYGH